MVNHVPYTLPLKTPGPTIALVTVLVPDSGILD